MSKIFYTILLFIFCRSLNTQAQNKVRLAKKIIISNAGTNLVDYTYEPYGFARIVDVTENQNGALIAIHYSFTFNNKGLVTSYATKSGMKTWGNNTTIQYDSINRITQFIVTTKNNTQTIKHFTYQYNADTVSVTDQLFERSKTNYIFNDDSNIVSTQNNVGSKFSTYKLNLQYDYSQNPQLLLGGFVNEIPTSKNNSLIDNLKDKYTINRKIEYEKILVSQYKPGGPKIPTQYKNGLPLKITETRFDKAYNKIMPVSTTTYQYIKL